MKATGKAKMKNKGALAPGKVQVNWRILLAVYNGLQEEATKSGFGSVPAFLNNLLTRYLRGERIQRNGTK